MARNIKFPLIMKGDIEVRTKSELINNFSLFDVIENKKNGKLVLWLRNIFEDDIADAIDELEITDPEIEKKICCIFDVDYNEEIKKTHQDAAIRKEKLDKLREYSDDEKYAGVIDSIAFSQDELFDLIGDGVKEIYLCGDKFEIPLSKGNIKYIGINCPQIIICSKEKVDWNEKKIVFENTVFDEKYKSVEQKSSELEEKILDQLVEKVKKEKNKCKEAVTKEDLLFIDMILEKVEEFHNLDVDMDDYCDDFETEEIDADDYDNDEYNYDTKSQAKHACKDQIVLMIKNVSTHYSEIRDEKKDEIDSAFQDLDETINTFINDLYVEMDDYIEFADPEDNCHLQNLRNNIDIVNVYIDYRFAEKIAKYVDFFLVKEFKSKKKMNEYLAQCDFDDDGEMYCYDLSSCADDLNSELYDVLDAGLVNAKKAVEMIYDDVKDVIGINILLALMKEYGIVTGLKAVDIDFSQIKDICNSTVSRIIVKAAVAKMPTNSDERNNFTRKSILKNADIWSDLYDELGRFVESNEKNNDDSKVKTVKMPTITKKLKKV